MNTAWFAVPTRIKSITSEKQFINFKLKIDIAQYSLIIILWSKKIICDTNKEKDFK